MYSINKKKPEKIRRYFIYPLAEGIFLAVLALFLTSVTAYFIYHHALSAIQAEIKDGLLRTASGIAACLDGDEIASFDSPEKKDLPAYLNTVTLLQNARLATKHCTYLYVNRMASDSVVFVVDPTPVDENGKPLFSDEMNLEPSVPMSKYPDASKELIEALTKLIPVVSLEAYTDKWGTFYSAYVPIFDSRKRCVGTLGADLRIDDMLARCKPIEEATKRAFFVSVVLAMLFGTLIWFTRRFSLQLNESRFSLLENFVIAREFADQASVRIGRQLNRTAQIVQNISQRLGSVYENEEKAKMPVLLRHEQTRLANFAQKLRDVAALKCSKTQLELGNFKIAAVQENLKKQLCNCCDSVDNFTFEIDKEIPGTLYGSIQTFEELIVQMGQFFLKMMPGSVKCEITLLHEGNQDVVLQQTMKASLEGVDSQRLALLKHFSQEIQHEDFFEEIELVEAVSVSIARELIYLLNSDIRVIIEADSFTISFESVFQKAVEESEEEED